ncbi:MAG TPA: hypothetical protein VFR40_00480 [Lapillicoccus sp.]|nr:hypothetical protein [Lapillicoccus sp.]
MVLRRFLATAAAAAVGCALLAGCTRDPKPLPPKEATPRQVLDAYLLALQAGDCGTTHEYAVDRFVSDGDLCGKVNVLSYRHDGYRSQPSPDEVVLADTLTVRGGDQSLPDGDHLWFYTLKQQPNGAWRISAAGSGP